jgi:hypothetical protein
MWQHSSGLSAYLSVVSHQVVVPMGPWLGQVSVSSVSEKADKSLALCCIRSFNVPGRGGARIPTSFPDIWNADRAPTAFHDNIVSFNWDAVVRDCEATFLFTAFGF